MLAVYRELISYGIALTNAGGTMSVVKLIRHQRPDHLRIGADGRIGDRTYGLT
jgi:hypothetical protein